MPRMEESLAGYLAAPLASSWRAPTLPSKPCHFTSRLVGKAYAAAGQAGGTLHTISVLQAYQADLLRDADAAGGVAPVEIEELRRSSVVHTIETINNSSFLPGVRLGYYICDTCSDASKAIQSTEQLLAVNGTLSLQCEVHERPNVKAIIGARFSEDSLAVARLLSLYMVPQISTTSSAQTLSDRVRYPAFLRTIPSDVHQTKALINFMKHFHWDWVGVVYGDDDYGKNALQSFLADSEAADICHAFKEVLPHYLAHNEIDKRIQEVAETIRLSEAKVVVLILKEELVSKLFKEMIRQNISRTWIASDAWSMSRNISQMEGINQLGDIFGFTFITGPNPGFKEFLQQLTLAPGSVNLFLEEYKQLGKDTGFLTEAVDISMTYGERTTPKSLLISSAARPPEGREGLYGIRQNA
ncbi:hypothetical protein G5714_017327 [Onychostoma macrolepis]|uniref:Receptor ligand binding region domain-containing protein n=1 Tax=Onychostoma macrolepis TaxID=369639 RepID=A0A7J6C5E9_9TELE|nr:hypothetical protein G5714_017327 [Onychostoma macrolepis]